MDVAIRSGGDNFSTGMLIRDHEGKFLAGRVSRTSGPAIVLEAETNVLYEGLCWLKSLPFQNVLIKSDSLLTVQAVQRSDANRLEIGHLFDITAEGFCGLD